MQSFLIWLLVIFCGAFFTLCDSLSANWGKTGDWKSMAIVCILSPFTYLFFGLLNQKVNLGIAGSLVNLTIVMGTVFVGIFYFHETLTSVQYIGPFLALVAIALLNT